MIKRMTMGLRSRVGSTAVPLAQHEHRRSGKLSRVERERCERLVVAGLGRRPERECARPVELRERRVLGRHLPPPVKLAMMAAVGALGIALAAGCIHTPSTTTSTSASGSAAPPSPAALPTSSATLRQRVSAYARCIGVRRDPAPRYDAQQPDAFASAGPGSADLFMYLNPRGRPIAVDILSATTPVFASAAVGVVSAWTFRPATCDGKPVYATYDVHLEHTGTQ